MKKIIFALLLTVYCFAVNAQARNGYTKAEIKSEFSEYSQESSYANDGTPMLTVEMPLAYVAYYFLDGICTRTAIFPLNQSTVQLYVEKYNNTYVIISSTEWKYYSGGDIFCIKMTYAQDTYIFIIDYSE